MKSVNRYFFPCVVSIFILFSISLYSTDSNASTAVWSMLSNACQVRITSGSNDNITHLYYSRGYYTSLAGTSASYAYLFCPVWLPDDTVVENIGIRYYENHSDNMVTAGFYSQSFDDVASGTFGDYGYVSSTNSANDPNYVEDVVDDGVGADGVTISNDENVYFILILLNRVSQNASALKSYSVSLTVD